MPPIGATQTQPLSYSETILASSASRPTPQCVGPGRPGTPATPAQQLMRTDPWYQETWRMIEELEAMPTRTNAASRAATTPSIEDASALTKAGFRPLEPQSFDYGELLVKRIPYADGRVFERRVVELSPPQTTDWLIFETGRSGMKSIHDTMYNADGSVAMDTFSPIKETFFIRNQLGDELHMDVQGPSYYSGVGRTGAKLEGSLGEIGLGFKTNMGDGLFLGADFTPPGGQLELGTGGVTLNPFGGEISFETPSIPIFPEIDFSISTPLGVPEE